MGNIQQMMAVAKMILSLFGEVSKKPEVYDEDGNLIEDPEPPKRIVKKRADLDAGDILGVDMGSDKEEDNKDAHDSESDESSTISSENSEDDEKTRKIKRKAKKSKLRTRRLESNAIQS